jgi:hypothetical protein
MLRAAGLFVGLPEEFSPPEATAERIAALGSRAEREALWIRIPSNWQPIVGHFACRAIALEIADEMPEIEDRRAALSEVPEIWLTQVQAFVKSFWSTRDIRARYREERAARRARQEEAA